MRVSTAEKRAEGPLPLCTCHGEPQFWNSDSRYDDGGYWLCAVSKREATFRLWERNLGYVAEELERRGGCCVHPGCLRTDIQWHHRDPDTRESYLAILVRSGSKSKILAELEKCDPLCPPHHSLADKERRSAERKELLRYRALYGQLPS